MPIKIGLKLSVLLKEMSHHVHPGCDFTADNECLIFEAAHLLPFIQMFPECSISVLQMTPCMVLPGNVVLV